MYELSEEEFEQAIEDAIDSIPERFVDDLENVVFLAEDEPEDWQLERSDGCFSPGGGGLLGLYDGVSLSERGSGYGGLDDYPDTISIFKGPHERLEGGREEILEEIRKTVVHEVGHYFGMTEEQIEEMGYA